MRRNRFLKVAVWLWVLAVLTAASLVPSLTQAKYVASAEASASARVAKWWPFAVFNEAEASYPISPAGPAGSLDDDDGDSIELNFDPSAPDDYRTTVTLTNRSEVTARYRLIPSVTTVGGAGSGQDYDDFLAAVKNSVTFKSAVGFTPPVGYAYDPGDGIAVPFGREVELDIVIPAVAFTGLEIGVASVQVD